VIYYTTFNLIYTLFLPQLSSHTQVRRRIELGASHGRALPPPETMDDHLTEHFFEGFEMVKRIPPVPQSCQHTLDVAP
jgi:hypothetical protein